MLSIKPYLIRAYHDWIIDSNYTPLIVIDANHPRCKVPKDYIANGEIVFNVSPGAVRDLKVDNMTIEFKASFGGVVHLISAPLQAVIGIYAEENGEGIFFDMSDEEEGESSGAGNDDVVADGLPMMSTSAGEVSAESGQPAKGKPFLRLVD